MLAATLAEAMRAFEPDVRLSGIGSERMRAAGFDLTTQTRGWASMGPLEALRKIPPLFVNVWRHVIWLRLSPRDLIVLVDFGAYNLRFARALRRVGYRAPILYYFPPGAWLDREKQAREVARLTVPLTAFAHQRDFYASLGLDIAWFGHPLASLVEPRAARPSAPPDGGTVALLPGSRRGEVERHAPRLIGAAQLLRARRPDLRVVVSAADAETEGMLRERMRAAGFDAPIVRGAREALDAADVALVASGTAVLEAALREVPAVALYVIARAQVPIAKRVWRGRFITLPNILLDRAAVPELLQDAATPEALADAADGLLHDPAGQIDAYRALRARLGPPDALARCAAFAVALARGGAS
jgi:lipid-A-disaccharide synthase